MSEDGKQTPHVFPIEKTAWDILTPYAHRHATSAVYANDSESALEGKFLTNAARVALILHVVNLIESEGYLSDCKPIPGETMKSACIIAEWFTDESKRIYAELAGEAGELNLTPEQREVMRVLARVGTATERDIKRHSRPIQKWETEKLEKILHELLKLDRVTRHSEDGKGNRGTTWWQVKNSTVDTVDADANSAEHGKYGISVSVNTVNTEKNEKSTLSEFDSFSDER